MPFTKQISSYSPVFFPLEWDCSAALMFVPVALALLPQRRELKIHSVQDHPNFRASQGAVPDLPPGAGFPGTPVEGDRLIRMLTPSPAC